MRSVSGWTMRSGYSSGAPRATCCPPRCGSGWWGRTKRDRVSLGVVTNDIFTREDAEFLVRNEALPRERIRAVETGGCPHAAIREDISHNLLALEQLMEEVHPDLLFVESGGDNLAAQYS